MFNFSKTQTKYTRYIVDYDYPVGMDTKPTITFGIADDIFGKQNYSETLSSGQAFLRLSSLVLIPIRRVFRQSKKWRAGNDNS